MSRKETPPAAGKIYQHTHCNVCGRAVPLSDKVCSDKCQKEFDQLVKTRKTYMYVMYGAIVLIFMVYVFSMINA